MRIRSYDEETEELSADLANISGDIADLTKTANNPQGISLFTDKNQTEYKSTYQILREISYIYDELTDKQQADLLEKLFGKTRAQAGAAILSNFEAAENAMNVMGDSAGSADEEMEIIKDSLEYKINSLKETWVGFLQSNVTRDFLGGLIDNVTRASEVLVGFVDIVGILPAAIGLTTMAFGAKNFVSNFDQPL